MCIVTACACLVLSDHSPMAAAKLSAAQTPPVVVIGRSWGIPAVIGPCMNIQNEIKPFRDTVLLKNSKTRMRASPAIAETCNGCLGVRFTPGTGAFHTRCFCHLADDACRQAEKLLFNVLVLRWANAAAGAHPLTMHAPSAPHADDGEQLPPCRGPMLDICIHSQFVQDLRLSHPPPDDERQTLRNGFRAHVGAHVGGKPQGYFRPHKALPRIGGHVEVFDDL